MARQGRIAASSTSFISYPGNILWDRRYTPQHLWAFYTAWRHTLSISMDIPTPCDHLDFSTCFSHPRRARETRYGKMRGSVTQRWSGVSVSILLRVGPPEWTRSVPNRWHNAPRRWGHRLHSLCSYMAMFPPAIPHLFIRWLTKPGDAVYDPFSGRGTTVLEACLAGRVGLASDANPLAWLLSRAKCDPPTRASIATRLRQLAESEPGGLKVSAPADIEMLFAPRVLSQLVWLQTELDRSRRVDRFLLRRWRECCTATLIVRAFRAG